MRRRDLGEAVMLDKGSHDTATKNLAQCDTPQRVSTWKYDVVCNMHGNRWKYDMVWYQVEMWHGLVDGRCIST